MFKNIIRTLFVIFLFISFTTSLVIGRSNQTIKSVSSRLISPEATPAYCIAEHNVGRINLAVTNNGTFGKGHSRGGSYDCFTGHQVQSCEYPAGSRTSYLYGASYWIGAVVGRDTLVSVGADGWLSATEMHPDDMNGMIKRSSLDSTSMEFWQAVSEQDFIAVCTDTITSGVNGLNRDEITGRPHIPLNIELTQKSYSWSYPYTEDYVLFDCAVKNIGTELLEDVYIGIYVDSDVKSASAPDGFDDDIAGFLQEASINSHGCSWDEDLNIAWIADGDGELGSAGQKIPIPHVTATRILREPSYPSTISFNWWISNGNAILDFGPQKKCCFRDLSTGGTGTPAGDLNKYAFLSNGEIDYDQVYTKSIKSNDPDWSYPPQTFADNFSDGFDAKYLLSFGPFDLNPGQSAPFVYTYVAGENFHTNRNNMRDNIQYFYQPDIFMDNVNFDDLVMNARWADWIYDNPGVDTDSDGYGGTFQMCNDDTIWISGDDIPDFNAASAPPSPSLRLETTQDEITIYWNGLKTETAKDVFSGRVDFEGYKIYLSGSDSGPTLGGFALIGSYDIPNYQTLYWSESNQQWGAYDDPKTVAELRCQFGTSCDDNSFFPAHYTKDKPLEIEFPVSYIVAFEPYGNNGSDGIRKSYPSQPYPSSLVPWQANPDELTPEGKLKYFEYEITIDNLFGAECYQLAVVAYDYGSAMAGVPSQMGNVLDAVTEACLPGVAEVDIDIQPGICPNSLGVVLISRILDEDEEPPITSAKITPIMKTIEVSMLGSAEFNVADIDPATLSFQGKPSLSWEIIDNSSLPYRPLGDCDCSSIAPDGFEDLNVTFEKPKNVIVPFGFKSGEAWPLSISGSLYDGTLIFGSDCVTLTRSFDRDITPTEETNVVLLGSHPNPFNPTTEIRFSLQQAQNVKIELFNILGQKVDMIIDQRMQAGEHSVSWNGSGFASGLYFYRLSTINSVKSGKMMLVK